MQQYPASFVCVRNINCAAAAAAAASLAATPIYTAELYPTPVRSTALGMCNKACRCGSISAPFLLMLGTHTAAAFGSALFMPYVFVGCVCLLAGALVLLMPETLGKDMPECMEVG